MPARRVSPAAAGAVVAAFVLGGILAITIDRATSGDTGTLRGTATVAEAPESTIPEPLEPPLRVVATKVQYPAGYTATFANNGPAFVYVDGGRIEIEANGTTAVYVANAFSFQEEGQVYTMRVLDDAQLSIVRLLAPGEEPLVEVR